MTYKGHVEDGVIVLDETVKLKDGMHVFITIKKNETQDPTGVAGSWVDSRSADDIIKEIKKARRSKK